MLNLSEDLAGEAVNSADPTSGKTNVYVYPRCAPRTNQLYIVSANSSYHKGSPALR